jgi:type IV pilus assembly protein PilN
VIQFNLLPHRAALRKFQQDQFNASLVLTVILGGVTGLAVSAYFISAIAAQENNIAVLENEIRHYEAQIAEANNLHIQIDALRARQKALEDLQADRNLPVRLLSELPTKLPQGISLIKLVQKDAELTLEGMAQSHESLSQFVENLGQDGAWFSKPELLVSEAQNFSPGGKFSVPASRFSVKVTFLRAQGVSAGETPSHAASGASPGHAASTAASLGTH